MATRGLTPISSTVTKTLVCVDAYGTEISGRIYNPYMADVIPFDSITALLLLLDEFFDRIRFPQAAYQSRSFFDTPPQPLQPYTPKREVQRYMSDTVFDNKQGKKATFVVQVQFRQNATWQGTITWNEEQRTCRFRSALEMLKLMDGALAHGEEKDTSSF